jgi:hypothetical protein
MCVKSPTGEPLTLFEHLPAIGATSSHDFFPSSPLFLLYSSLAPNGDDQAGMHTHHVTERMAATREVEGTEASVTMT